MVLQKEEEGGKYYLKGKPVGLAVSLQSRIDGAFIDYLHMVLLHYDMTGRIWKDRNLELLSENRILELVNMFFKTQKNIKSIRDASI